MQDADRKILRRETLRYLGCGGSQPDERTLILVDNALEKLILTCRPRSTYKMVNMTAEADRIMLEGGTVFNSASLGRALCGCSQMMAFGATLGVEADTLIRKESLRNIASGAAVQAAATALIEEYCDEMQAELEKMLAAEGRTLGDRFSPGYGDFELRHQRELFALLDCPKKIGLTLTEDFIMIPSKSVTAVMAVDGNCGRQLGCEYCGKKDCLYRRK